MKVTMRADTIAAVKQECVNYLKWRAERYRDLAVISRPHKAGNLLSAAEALDEAAEFLKLAEIVP